uniref:Beta-hexosaminidase n=1 Tax=Phaeomonas parva TaxID=124430 RepID=A0A7S1UCH9_9STRA|mmetsp:Transcript_38600/g.120883  ORF Transcript_38600/g.120883 Transcript_38600/m.120883 type:complete len:512 (+) Transcript_38600:81-1616(+)
MRRGLCALAFALCAGGSARGAVWPKPRSAQIGQQTAYFATVQFRDTSPNQTPELHRAFKRYEALILTHPAEAATGSKGTLYVEVHSFSAGQMNVAMHEAYQMSVDNDAVGKDTKVLVKAQTFIGALRALETLSQLTRFDFDKRAYRMDGLPMAFDDGPRFQHRGALIDTARHFLPLSSIYAVLDSLSYAKMNVLHWHMVDSQSFPVSFPSHAELAREGAFSPSELYDVEDLKSVVAYARDRGIRVMAELDSPMHTASWCGGQPGICPDPEACPEPLDVSKEETFKVIGDLFDDIRGIFPDGMLHIGGDEVKMDCWNQSASITAWRDEKGFSLDDAYHYFTNRVIAMAMERGYTVVGWDEMWKHFGTTLPRSTVIQNWNMGNQTDVTNAGYRVLYTSFWHWYLDHTDTTWQDAYAANPAEGVANGVKVLGGEGALWGEYVDASDLMATLWPRLGAIAERLWSVDGATRDLDDAEQRLADFRCLLNRRGIPAAPLNNSIAREEPPGPGDCAGQ